jgi:hypothetical protein
MFAIGYGIPPNGPLRALRLAATPLARDIAGYLASMSSTTMCSTTAEPVTMPVPPFSL